MSVGQLLLRLDASSPWCEVNRADLDANAIYRRHYSAAKKNSRQYVGPGSYIALVSADLDALFVWRKFIDDTVPRQRGISCAVFRNESRILSSTLILAAERIARRKWPRAKRLYTLVDAKKTRQRRSKRHMPGHCFIAAGWRWCGVSKTGLIILEKHLGRAA